jgi:two-component system sensor histidine kinase KdpD
MSMAIGTLTDRLRRRKGASRRRAAASSVTGQLLSYLAALGAIAVCTALIAILRLPLPGAHLSILYILPVLALASTRGRGPALTAAVLGVLAYDYLFVEPFFTLAIRDADDWLALLVFLFTALVTGHLAASLRLRAEEARARGATGILLLGQLALAQRARTDEATARAALTTTLYELTQTLIADREPEQLLALIAEQVVATFGVRDCAILLPDATGQLAVRACYPPDTLPPTARRDEAVTATWTFASGATALPTRYGAVLFVPLQAGTRRVGLMRVTRAEGDELDDERRPLLSTFSAGAALAIERGLLAEATVRAAVLARSDALKSTLLASVSHELRTPLAAIKGSVSSLLEDEADVTWDPALRREFLLTIDEETDRLTRLVGNLLDLSHIEAGVLQPHREPYALDELLWGIVDRLPPPVAARI